jgi:hypothetical protein
MLWFHTFLLFWIIGCRFFVQGSRILAMRSFATIQPGRLLH